MELVGDFGENLGYDGKAVRSNSTGRRNRTTSMTSDPEADQGKHRVSGVDSAARTWTKIKSWFGYRIAYHCRHEIRNTGLCKRNQGFGIGDCGDGPHDRGVV